jgi:hypothetical protein
VIAWRGSKLFPTVATSTTEAGYMTAAWTAKEALLTRMSLAPFQEETEGEAIEIKFGNQDASALIQNPTCHQRAKHSDVCHHVGCARVLGPQPEHTGCPT